MTSRKIFIDSSILYSFIDRGDGNHNKAIKVMEHFSVYRFNLYTSIQVIQETFNTLSSQLGKSMSLEFLQATLQSNIEILYPQKGDLLSAFRLMKFNRDRQISLKEALICALMQKKNIVQVCTFASWNNFLGTQTYEIF